MGIQKDRLLERFLRYVRCSSESRNEKEFCELVEEELKQLGLTVKRDLAAGEKCGSNGWNISAVLPGEGEPILLCAHMDTVSPGVGVEPVVEDGIVRSKGDTILGSDDKSGVAAIIEGLAAVIEDNIPHCPTEILFTICEEPGMLGSKAADLSGFKSKQALVLDSSRGWGCVVHRLPGQVVLKADFNGKRAHAATCPETGIHALKAAAAAVAQIPCGAVDGQTTMNVANFLSPGVNNIVPDKASFIMEIRSFDQEILERRLADAKAAMQSACDEFGATHTIEILSSSRALTLNEDAPLMQRTIHSYRALGVEPQLVGAFGLCDAVSLADGGIDALDIGTGMTNVHGTSEYIKIEDLNSTTELVVQMMRAKE